MRLNYRQILGETLTSWIAREYGRGKSKHQIINEIFYLIKNKLKALTPISDVELYKRISINVGARISEMNAEKTAYKDGLADSNTWIARVRIMKNGTMYIYVSNKTNIKPHDLVVVKATKLKKE